MAKAKLKNVQVDLPKPEAAPGQPDRTIKDIQDEFSSLCTRSGHLEYQVFTFKKDIDLLNTRMRELNFEAAALQGKQQAAPSNE
jgi:septal ring factor EnvC (AmiA/AmiB activator)